MNVNWLALGQVFLVSLAVTVAVMVLFASGVLALSKPGPAQRVVAVGSFALCGLVTLLGIAVILA